MQVIVVMGSKSDWETMKNCTSLLNEFHVSYEARVLSAHRTPEALSHFLKQSEESGAQVIIAAAGLAAHLAGVVASQTLLPVIGVPMEGGPLKGVDALYSIVQMPPGIPVSSMAIGKPGAINSALTAISILALHDANLKSALQNYRHKQADKILAEKLE